MDFADLRRKEDDDGGKDVYVACQDGKQFYFGSTRLPMEMEGMCKGIKVIENEFRGSEQSLEMWRMKKVLRLNLQGNKVNFIILNTLSHLTVKFLFNYQNY